MHKFVGASYTHRTNCGLCTFATETGCPRHPVALLPHVNSSPSHEIAAECRAPHDTRQHGLSNKDPPIGSNDRISRPSATLFPAPCTMPPLSSAARSVPRPMNRFSRAERASVWAPPHDTWQILVPLCIKDSTQRGSITSPTWGTPVAVA